MGPGTDKQGAWRSSEVASEYEARRFHTPLQRIKHRRDERLVLDLLHDAEGARPAGRPREPWAVLDLPCGTGRLIPALIRAGYEVVGGDLSLEMMRAGKAHGDGVARLQLSALRLPFRKRSFRAVVSMRFLFHIRDRRQRIAMLREMRRVAREVVIGQVRYRWTAKHLGRWARSRVGRLPRYRPSNDRQAIADELREAGLELIELRPLSRVFSDKALFAARPVSSDRPT